MARRGMSNEERFALDSAHASATGTVKSGPLYLYGALFEIVDTNATAEITMADGTSTATESFADVDAIARVKLGAGGASAEGTSVVVWNPPKPILVKRDVIVSATNGKLAILYFPAQ